MSLYADAQRIRGIAKHAPDDLDPDEVRAFACRVLDHLGDLADLLGEASVSIPGSALPQLIDRG